MCPAFPRSRLDTILHPLFAFLPGRGVYDLGLTALKSLLKLGLYVNAALAPAFLPNELADVFACSAVPTLISLFFHPLL